MSVQRNRATNPVERVFRASRGVPQRVKIRTPDLRPKHGAISPLWIVYGFATLILIGTVLLWLPASTIEGQHPSLVTALFTSTSAVCVTGLVIENTGTYWSSFGQGVILILIQLGGLGIMTSAALFLWMFGRRIGIRQRLLMGETLGVEALGGVVRIVRRIVIFSLVAEGAGALLFYWHFLANASLPVETALWRAVFQSVSAFNNAGFDIFGGNSMEAYHGNVLMLLVTAGLVILGGLSLLVVADVIKVRRFHRFALDTKIVLITTGALLVAGTIIILVSELSNEDTLGSLSWAEKILDAFFLSVMPRTAGFSTIDMSALADYSLFFIILLMFVGGAAGSTAGGIKVNTFGMLASTIWSTLRGKEHAGAFGREFKPQQINRALALVMLALAFVALVALTLTIIEGTGDSAADGDGAHGQRFIDLLFETVSAFGTVGLSTGITPHLETASKLILIGTMFVGRLGPLALALALIQRAKPVQYRYPEGAVRIG